MGSTQRFKINNLTVTMYVDSVKSSKGESFRVVGVCPVCQKPMQAGLGTGEIYKENEVVRTYKKNIKKHLKNIHNIK